MEARHDDAMQVALDQLRLEIEELRAARERLVVAGDAEHRAIERELHDGPQQHLVALAINLQLARQLTDSDLPAVRALLEQMERDVQRALDETAELAERIYPPLLEPGGLTAALRSAAVRAGIAASVNVAVEASESREVSRTVYSCWLGALARADARASIVVRSESDGLAFEVVDDRAHAGAGVGSDAELDLLRDRIEALGGSLTVEWSPGGGTRLFGSLPVPR